MSIDELLRLVTDAANGKDDFKKESVGFYGYGFVFKDLNLKSDYVKFSGSSKVFGVGNRRDFIERLENKIEFKSFDELIRYDDELDLLQIGSVKTLVPTLEIGGYEMLFDVWMFVKTPDGKMFPARFYWGQSGISIAGWQPDLIDIITKKKAFPEDFEAIINFSPFNFSDKERIEFIEALEHALYKVPVSDFWGVYNHDLGNSLMGVQNKKPYCSELGHIKKFPKEEKYDEKLKPYLNKVLENEMGDLFTIKLLPGRKWYVIDYNDTLDTLGFGNARQMLNNLDEIDYLKKKKK